MNVGDMFFMVMEKICEVQVKLYVFYFVISGYIKFG